MASKTESPEFETVRGKFVLICDCIATPDVVKFAGELLQSNLIGYAGHQDAIAPTQPSNKVARLVSEAMNNASNSPDNFYKFVSILESRNAQLSATLKSDYSEQVFILPPEPKRRKEDPIVKFVTNLRQLYRTVQPPTWDPLPQCQYVKLAMIKKKRKRYGSDKTIVESRVEGDVDKLLTIKVHVPVDSDRIFDAGTFDDEHQVILVEGVGGMGKTSFAYQYAKNWAEGKLSIFDAVALVRLRDLNEHDECGVDRILPHLLSLASGNSISKEKARLIVDKQKILLILDGWDEAPVSIRKPCFVKDLLQSVSPQTRILITSRPDSSLDLHGLANRVEILGFNKDIIREYFENALKSSLPNSEVQSACGKLSSHFRQYPAIESCCYVPLNAAILAYIYLNRDQTLPVTRCELFQELILCCIVRELNTRQPNRVLEDVSSFENLPPDLKEQLYNLSELAFKGVMLKKIVFEQKELASLATLGLLHSVQGFGSIGRKFVTCNFIHFSVQELLAAYYITQIEPDDHATLFETLLNENLNFSTLQYYAGLTGLANESVRKLITGFGYQNKRSRLCLLAFLNCIYEARISDQAFFEQMVSKLGYTLQLSSHILSPMDCISLHYFLSFIRVIARGKMTLLLNACRLDDYSCGLLLGETPISSSGIMDSVKKLYALSSSFSDTGLDRLVKTLYHPNPTCITTLETLYVGSGNVTDMGLVPLLEALPRQHSLQNLKLSWSSTCPEISLKRIGEFVGKSTLNNYLHLFPDCSSCEQENSNLIQSVVTGVTSLVRSFTRSCIKSVHIIVTSRYSIPMNEQTDPCSQIQEAVKLVNAERETKLTVDVLFLPIGL